MVAYTEQRRSCVGGSRCLGQNYSLIGGVLAGTTDRYLGDGVITLSPDGRSYILASRLGNTVSVTIGDIQLGSQVKTTDFGVIGDGRQSLANGPIALLRFGYSGSPILWKAGQITSLDFQRYPYQARLNAVGDRIVYESQSDDGKFDVHSYSVASGRDIVLASGSIALPPKGYPLPTMYSHLSLTLDGGNVLYVLDNRLVVQPTDGGSARILTSAAEDTLVDAVISGSGNVAYAATSTGRLLRVDVGSGEQTELVAAVPHLEVIDGASAPGGRIDVKVIGPSPSDPAIDGANAVAPVVARSGDMITLQIPWEATPDSMVQVVASGSKSGMVEAHDLYVAWGIPGFYMLPAKDVSGTNLGLVAHQDFSGFVTPDSPARPGEIVHFYVTGLGAVSPLIATGAVTPVGTLYPLARPPVCTVHYKYPSEPADILFVGLAPGTIGVEQMDVRVPTQAVGPTLQLSCSSYGLVGYFSGGAGLAVAP